LLQFEHSQGDFTTQLRALCRTFSAEQAIFKRIEKEPPPTGLELSPSIRDVSRSSDRWFAKLRELRPPVSSGVSVSEWRRVIDLLRSDLSASDSFYAKWYPKLLASFKKPHAAPKLPPDTGPTAKILAQAFNSPEGREFVRLQQQLLQRTQAHSAKAEQIFRKVGLDKTCGDGTVTAPLAMHK